MFSAAVDDADIFLLFWIEVARALHQLGESQNCVEGSAEFVAHVGQKSAFGEVGCFCGPGGLLELYGLLLSGFEQLSLL